MNYYVRRCEDDRGQSTDCHQTINKATLNSPVLDRGHWKERSNTKTKNCLLILDELTLCQRLWRVHGKLCGGSMHDS